jgi:adenylosuccinate synthase
MNTKIVLGLLFGDEGKGNTTAHFARNDNSLVIRFNGGHQAGHTVVKDNYRHIFSSFGSGTLNGASTFISEYCTFSPSSFYNEHLNLSKNGYSARHFIHPLAMVTTPFDIEINRRRETLNQHGSVGSGFGTTIERSQSPYKLYVVDLLNEDLLILKLRQIATQYYSSHFLNIEEKIAAFVQEVRKIALNIRTLDQLLDDYDTIIFEGAQGIMLDMDFGYFPNVTRSNTTSKNAMEIIRKYNLPEPNIYYCMRSYLTRHGNGFMPNESSELNFTDETNKQHEFQGKFRQGTHSMEMIRYAIMADTAFSGGDFQNKHLCVSCLDQTDSKILIENSRMSLVQFKGKLDTDLTTLSGSTLGLGSVWGSTGPCKEDIILLIDNNPYNTKKF